MSWMVFSRCSLLTGGVILPPHRLILLSGPCRGRHVSA
ncbi:hypothetical protein LHGZ1_2561 [Laribacter hongkongensis]|uniref:Uncharacterized protein n=1 Tax=Laribacter hongkongensis TaxID=168471 RepID=A0A248LL53_9NEIS|nr:hypothetical protein LHGZ1_2561 [Laribacter hongkongensis]